jgi:hypothetical protein
MGKKGGIAGLKVGDLVERNGAARRKRLAIIIEMCMEDYYEFNPWIRIVYVDDLGGYEWVRRPGVKIVGDKEQK